MKAISCYIILFLPLMLGSINVMIAQCEGQLAVKEEIIKDLEKLKDNQKARLDAQEDLLEEKDGEIAKLIKDISNLKAQLEQQKKESTQSSDALKDEHNKTIYDLKDSHSKALKGKDKTIRERGSEISRLKQDLTKAKNKVKPLDQKISTLELRVGQKDRDLDKKEEKIKGLEDKNQSYSNEIRTLKKEKEDIEKERDNYKTDYEDSNNKLKTCENDLLEAETDNIQKQKLIDELQSLKALILEDIKKGVNALYNAPPTKDLNKLKELESQLNIASNFQDAQDVKALEAKFANYKTQIEIINKAQELLELKYNKIKNQNTISNLNHINISSLMAEKNKLKKLHESYCNANDKVVKIFDSIHDLGNSLDIRKGVMETKLSKLEFNLADYPFLKRMVNQKKKDIMSDTMPGGMRTETCN